ncbi:CDP-diacylglycerol--serine O-phosphatidyltransferase [Nakamurella flavida]|uniref:CDP-diacylglycerol--serine O-phosphatidyltransferase n=1 Tax=Nakamurella flavida TaxID=363630 RepID=A0A938YNY1_9ACTN|nr:CDP-diacylglycerol--serine O-phosphatidyltransferase [Nakamurella flavida]MBM9478031.1 CDP-diacylglycerol--serine O-phosphatidyltransferase [Nakamurella flavida]MDP9778252.1 CDP-diacylglycerol--serine O-phosphatidyltransferase [Nakamurella flavida]
MTGVPGVRFLPNAITVLALSSGLTSVAFALRGQWFFAVTAVVAAAIFDSLDGPAARLLNSTSRIGAELDSLSDCVSFGMAPALITYIWLLEDTPVGWTACLVFAVCAALRLARFNSLLDDDSPKPWAKGFFTGVPTPAGGLLALMPVLLSNRLTGQGPWNNPWVVSFWLVLVGVLMVSRVPSIALKSVRVTTEWIVPMLVLLVVAVAALVYQPEIVFSLGLLIYLLHLPYAVWKFQYLKNHPELWEGQRFRNRRTRRRVRLSVRAPRHQRVAGRSPDGSPLPPQRRRGAAGSRNPGARRRLR